MPTADAAAVSRAQEAVTVLHKGHGVRRSDLRHHLGRDLRLIWGIADNDQVDRVRAAVIHQLRVVLAGLTDRDRFVGELTYNLLPDADLRDAQLGIRQQRGCRRGPSPMSKRTVERIFEKVVLPEVCRSLANRPAPAPEHVITELMLSEQRKQHETAAVEQVLAEELPTVRLSLVVPDEPVPPLLPAPPRRPGPDGELAGFHAVLRVLNGASSAADEAVRRFLGIRVHGCWMPDGDLPVARAEAEGDWVCVFSSPALLAEYRRVAGARWSPRVFQLSGAELVRRVADRDTPTGVLLNPAQQRDGEVVESFALHPRTFGNSPPGCPDPTSPTTPGISPRGCRGYALPFESRVPAVRSCREWLLGVPRRVARRRAGDAPHR
jgi:hypothetical protein